MMLLFSVTLATHAFVFVVITIEPPLFMSSPPANIVTPALDAAFVNLNFKAAIVGPNTRGLLTMLLSCWMAMVILSAS
jgi:hypothetical protein